MNPHKILRFYKDFYEVDHTSGKVTYTEYSIEKFHLDPSSNDPLDLGYAIKVNLPFSDPEYAKTFFCKLLINNGVKFEDIIETNDPYRFVINGLTYEFDIPWSFTKEFPGIYKTHMESIIDEIERIISGEDYEEEFSTSQKPSKDNYEFNLLDDVTKKVFEAFLPMINEFKNDVFLSECFLVSKTYCFIVGLLKYFRLADEIPLKEFKEKLLNPQHFVFKNFMYIKDIKPVPKMDFSEVSFISKNKNLMEDVKEFVNREEKEEGEMVMEMVYDGKNVYKEYEYDRVVPIEHKEEIKIQVGKGSKKTEILYKLNTNELFKNNESLGYFNLYQLDKLPNNKSIYFYHRTHYPEVVTDNIFLNMGKKGRRRLRKRRKILKRRLIPKRRRRRPGVRRRKLWGKMRRRWRRRFPYRLLRPLFPHWWVRWRRLRPIWRPRPLWYMLWGGLPYGTYDKGLTEEELKKIAGYLKEQEKADDEHLRLTDEKQLMIKMEIGKFVESLPDDMEKFERDDLDELKDHLAKKLRRHQLFKRLDEEKFQDWCEMMIFYHLKTILDKGKKKIKYGITGKSNSSKGIEINLSESDYTQTDSESCHDTDSDDIDTPIKFRTSGCPRKKKKKRKKGRWKMNYGDGDIDDIRLFNNDTFEDDYDDDRKFQMKVSEKPVKILTNKKEIEQILKGL